MRRALAVFVAAVIFAVPAGFAFGQVTGGSGEGQPSDPMEVAPDAPEIVSSPETWDACEQILEDGSSSIPCEAVLEEFAPGMLPEDPADESGE